jgi:hypothetical protein
MTCTLAAFNLSDGATVNNATEEPTLLASNLLTRPPFDRWRTLAATGNVTLDYGGDLDVSQIVLLYTNATAACTVRVRAAPSVPVASFATFDTGTLDHQPGSRDWSSWSRTHFLLDLGSVVSERYWRFDVDQVSGATYYEAGRVGLLLPWRPSRGVDLDDRIQAVDDTYLRRSRNGTAHPVAGGLYRECELSLATLTPSEFVATAGDLGRLVRGRVPLLYAKNPRSLSLGTSSVGSVAMYTDSDLMDQCIYGYQAELWYPNTAQRQLRRMRVSLSEVVHP